MNAKAIVDLLEIRHSNDVTVPEAMLGPAGSQRIDLWVLKRSWAQPCFYGYEVKVSRSDFMGDDKWHAYLEACNQFAFVCPWGLIQPEELPAGVGLLWVSKTGKRLYTKRKAAHREIDTPSDLLLSVLINRARIVGPYQNNQTETSAEKWREWLEHRAEQSVVGRRVARVIARIAEDRVSEVMRENKSLQTKLEFIERFERGLAANGVAIEGNYWIMLAARAEARRLSETIDPGRAKTIEKAIEALQDILAAAKRNAEPDPAREPEGAAS